MAERVKGHRCRRVVPSPAHLGFLTAHLRHRTPDGCVCWTEGQIHPQTCFAWRAVEHFESMAAHRGIPRSSLLRRQLRGTWEICNSFALLPERLLYSSQIPVPGAEPAFPQGHQTQQLSRGCPLGRAGFSSPTVGAHAEVRAQFYHYETILLKVVLPKLVKGNTH